MSAAQELAKRLMKENRDNRRPWRKIASEDYQGMIAAGTLNRIAKSGGAWLPKDKTALAMLGLRKVKAAARHQTDLFDMSTAALRDALKNRQVISLPDIVPTEMTMRTGKKSRRVPA